MHGEVSKPASSPTPSDGEPKVPSNAFSLTGVSNTRLEDPFFDNTRGSARSEEGRSDATDRDVLSPGSGASTATLGDDSTTAEREDRTGVKNKSEQGGDRVEGHRDKRNIQKTNSNACNEPNDGAQKYPSSNHDE